MSSPLHNRRAFTLIELILALGLSAVLLALLASALSLGVSRAVGSRENVERARLIGGIVSLVRNDIHRAVIYNPQDTSAAMELAEASAGFDVDTIDEISSQGGSGGGGAGEGGGGGGGGGGSSGGGGVSDSSSGAAGAAATDLSLRQPLGVYGNMQELQIDVLREHPQYEVDATGAVVPPTAISGITTVRYGMGQGTTSLGETATARGGQITTGLVRQEVSRDLLNWATQTGNAASLAGMPQVVASEVTRLEFRYFDGTQLLESWDSALLEGQMPLAVEMRIWLLEEKTSDGEVVSQSESLPYVVTIALPGTWNAADAALVGATSTDTSTSTGSSSSSSSTGGGSTGGNR